MVRFSLAAVLVAAGVIAAMPALGQQKRASDHETISGMVGDKKSGNRVTITYGRPNAKGRQIWGGLVPYGKAWRTGADEATTLTTQQPIKIGNDTIPAGTYTLYTVPTDKDAKLAFSKKTGGWGIPVNEKEDLVRVDMKREPLDKKVDQFTMAITGGATSGTIKMMWENAQYSVEFANAK